MTDEMEKTETDAAAEAAVKEAIEVADKTAADVGGLEMEVAALKERLLRALAETENVRRRAEKEREDTARYAISGFAKDLLSVADSLARAVAAVPVEAREKDEFVKSLLVGVETTQRQMTQVFERFGIRRFESVNQPFNPHRHEVMFEAPEGAAAPGTVAQVLEDGYTIHDRLLRPARVAVAKGAPAGSEKVDEKI